jgi:hypothetical protein
MRKKLHSLPHLELSAIPPCRSASRMLERLTRAIQTCLADHWGKRVEAYVDDVVIKTENSENFIEDLQLVFNNLRRYR